MFGRDWHQGVIGIVAGKLRERYNVPAFVMSIESDEVKGSARSIDGLDLGALIISDKEKGIITGGGGHLMAAGIVFATPLPRRLFEKIRGRIWLSIPILLILFGMKRASRKPDLEHPFGYSQELYFWTLEE